MASMLNAHRNVMNGVLVLFTTAFLFIGSAAPLPPQGSSPDPVFATIPFDRWVEEGDPAHIDWNLKALPVELSVHQRLQARIELVMDGNELARRRGKGQLLMLVQFRDSEKRVYQTHENVDLQLVKEDAGRSNFYYRQAVFLLPGDYMISAAIFDTATGEHSAKQIPLHVSQLKNDALPGSWQDLPPVEIPKAIGSPDDLFLPDVTGRLSLPLKTRRPIRLEVVLNASPISASEPSGVEQVNNRSLAGMIPALKAMAYTDVRNGTLNVSVLDLTTQRVIFQQDAVHDLNWATLRPALMDTKPNSIDVHALENRQQNAQFFLTQIRERIDSAAPNAGLAESLPILIVLSGPMAFDSGDNLHPIEIDPNPDAKAFYVRYHSTPTQLPANPFWAGPRLGGRTPLSPSSRIPLKMSEPQDELEHTLKVLRPRLFDVYTPEQFRKALRNIIDEISLL